MLENFKESRTCLALYSSQKPRNAEVPLDGRIRGRKAILASNNLQPGAKQMMELCEICFKIEIFLILSKTYCKASAATFGANSCRNARPRQ
jgi:hypothetical protein